VDYQDLSREQLVKKLREYDRIIDGVPVGFCITDEEGYFEEVNSAYCDIYGYREEELIGEHFTIVVPDKNKEKLNEIYQEFINQGEELESEWVVKNKTGNKLNILVNAVKIRGKDGNYKKVTFVIDITKRKQLEKKLIAANTKLKERALRDSLTDLYNHGEIMQRLEDEISRTERLDSDLTIMMLDVDDFTVVNNKYGHVKGDKVLTSLANKLQDNIRQMDIVGRYGGDEFLIIFPDSDLDNACQVAKRIEEEISKEEIAGIGITISGGLFQFAGQSAEELVEEADKLLYQAKEKGPKQIIC
jgi:diguanylate cyclase (GGDEF)-like protein/PAS domain S-box-containing protein